MLFFAEENNTEHNLINIKNCGGLIYPSKDVIFICKTTESVIRLVLNENDGKLIKKKIVI